MPEKLERGTQIAYVPIHANGDLNHPDVERGFVTSGPNNQGDYFCRYWRKDLKQLRTKANSECTPRNLIVVIDSVSQRQVEKAIEEWC